jgi:hypothetical protein
LANETFQCIVSFYVLAADAPSVVLTQPYLLLEICM